MPRHSKSEQETYNFLNMIDEDGQLSYLWALVNKIRTQQNTHGGEASRRLALWIRWKGSGTQARSKIKGRYVDGEGFVGWEPEGKMKCPAGCEEGLVRRVGVSTVEGIADSWVECEVCGATGWMDKE